MHHAMEQSKIYSCCYIDDRGCIFVGHIVG